jgi:polyisoprenoid-binding protein YceI
VQELGPANATLTVRTGRQGVAALAGHDLVIEVERWSASLDLVPGDTDRSTVRATVDATSLGVREGTGGAKPISDSDRATIQGNIAKTLKTDRFPEITFESIAIYGTDGSTWQVNGRLTIAGSTQQVQIPVDAQQHGALSATVQIKQTDFGIKPYTGLLGALKVADAVEIQLAAQVDLSATA